MKSDDRPPARKPSNDARARARSRTRDQLKVLVVPAIIAVVVAWRTYASLGDLQLALILGCVAFVTLTPMAASMSGGELARKRRGR